MKTFAKILITVKNSNSGRILLLSNYFLYNIYHLFTYVLWLSAGLYFSLYLF